MTCSFSSLVSIFPFLAYGIVKELKHRIQISSNYSWYLMNWQEGGQLFSKSITIKFIPV